MNEENRLLLEKYRERRKMELSENILGNGGYVVEYGGKQYQKVGYHSEMGYLIICSAFSEEGFTIGREFKHEIPIIKNISYDIMMICIIRKLCLKKSKMFIVYG